jgi:ECF sigma factor
VALCAEDLVAARVAHSRLLGSLHIEKAQEALGISRVIACRNWKYAQAWLREALEE